MIRPLDIRQPPRSTLAWVGLLLTAVVLSSLLGLPLLHEALHEAGAPESECPVHVLQSGLALVLFAAVALLAMPFPDRRTCYQWTGLFFFGDPLRRSLAPRAPPVSL